MSDILKAPYPFFGGKSRIAGLVWSRFGRVDNYVEGFFGSGAMLLGRPVECGANPLELWPHCFGTETVNDADGYIANFHRALQYAPDEVAGHADHQVNEIDLHSWHRTLVDSRERVERMLTDPKYYDAELAGRWVWGISQWIGGDWCPRRAEPEERLPRGLRKDGSTEQRRPRLGGGGRSGGENGVHRASLHQKMPAVGGNGDGGQSIGGVHSKRLAQKRPAIGGRGHPGSVGGVHGKRLSQQMPAIAASGTDATGTGIHAAFFEEKTGALYDYFRALSARLRRVRVVCGDFARVLGPSVTWRHGMTAVMLDPPYADAEHAITYSGGGNVWERTTRWCEENGGNPLLRIALCGYSGSWEPPSGWTAVRWKAHGGYGSQGNGRGRENAERECVWFSPACIDPAEDARDALSRPIAVRESDWSGTLFDEADDAA